MRYLRLHVTATLLAFTSPAAAQEPAAKQGCELLPQFRAVLDAGTKISDTTAQFAAIIIKANRSATRAERVLHNDLLDVNVALGTTLIEILNQLGPDCLPKGTDRAAMIAKMRETVDLARTKRAPFE